MGELDDGPHDGVVVVADPEVAGHRAVEFQDVGAALTQRGERRHPHAEVVERQLHPDAAQGLEGAGGAALQVVDGALVDIECELRGFEVHRTGDGEDTLDEGVLLQLPGRDVHVHGERRVDQPGRQPGACIAAGLGEHPVADGYDRARLVGEMEELRRGEPTAGGVVPAQQCLGPDGTAAVGGHDGLVGEDEFVVGKRPFEFGAELALLGVLGPHRLGEDLDSRTATPLGDVHRRIGVTQQGDRRFAGQLPIEHRRAAECHADAHAEFDLDAAHHHPS